MKYPKGAFGVLNLDDAPKVDGTDTGRVSSEVASGFSARRQGKQRL